MARIGSRKIAEQVHNGIFGGLSLVSSGGTRKALLDESSGVVYKRQTRRSYGEDMEYGNEHEYRVASRLLAKCRNNDQWLNEFVRIPLVSIFRFSTDFPVIAMQFIEGSCGFDYTLPQGTIESRRALYSVGFADMHRGNFVIDNDGTIWPIDMGSARHRYPDSRALHPEDTEWKEMSWNDPKPGWRIR